MSKLFKTAFSLPIVAICVVIALLLGVLGGRLFPSPSAQTSSNSAVPASGKKIDVIVKAADSAFWQAMLAGAKKAGEDWGLQVGLFSATSEADVADQVRLFENSTSRGVNAIVVAASSSQALNSVINQARSQNIKVITVDNAVTTTSDGFIGTDNLKAGAQAADKLGAALAQRGITTGKVLLESSVAGIQVLIDRDSGFTNELKARYPGLTIIAHRYNNNDAPTALSQVNDVITANPDLVGIFADNNVSGDGAAQAISENKAQQRITAVAFDSDPQEVSALSDGSLAGLVVQNPFFFGYQGVLEAAMSIAGGYPPARLDPGAMLVDQSNVNDPAVRKLLNPPTTKGAN